MDFKRFQLLSFTTFVTKDLYIDYLLLIMEVIRSMKKKTIVFGSLLAVFLMLMIPNVGAVEYKTVVETNERYILQEIEKFESQINTIKEQVNGLNSKEIISAINNLEKNDLKQIVLKEFKQLEISEQQKEKIHQFIDSDLFSQVLLKGIVIPVLILLIGYLMADIFGFFPLLSGSVEGLIIGSFFLTPVSKIIEQETGIDYNLIALILLYVDLIISFLLSKILLPNSSNRITSY